MNGSNMLLAAAPEPSTTVLMMVGLAGVLAAKFRRSA